MAKIPVIHENDDGWSDWQDMGNKFSLICCCCALSHDFDFQLIDGRLQFKVSTNHRSTAALRRGWPNDLRKELKDLYNGTHGVKRS